MINTYFDCAGYRLGDTEGVGSHPLPETVSSASRGNQQEKVSSGYILSVLQCLNLLNFQAFWPSITALF